MDKKERVIATLKRCMDIQKTCGGCSYRKGNRGNGCMEKLFGDAIELLNQASAREKAMKACIVWHHREGGADSCSKCAYSKEVPEDCICRHQETEGDAACIEGMIKYFSEVQS